MEETLQFIYGVIKYYKVNIDGQINDIFNKALIAKQSPVIRNNFLKAIELLTNQGILIQKGNAHFLTEYGFSVIYS